MNAYDKLRIQNKNTDGNGNKLAILATSLSHDVCIVAKKNTEYACWPIELLLCAMSNNAVHINNFSRLRDWCGFENKDVLSRIENGYYPTDYKKNKKKYVVDITNRKGFHKTAKDFENVYETIGVKIKTAYHQNIEGEKS